MHREEPSDVPAPQIRVVVVHDAELHPVLAQLKRDGYAANVELQRGCVAFWPSMPSASRSWRD
jgi:hypothetical protein